MSSFNGENLFGSGPHVIYIDGIKADKHLFSFPNVHGSFDVGHGFRWRSGKIVGWLEGENIAELQSLISKIERYYVNRTAATLVDNWGRSFNDVVIDEFRTKDEIKREIGTGRLMNDYEVIFKQLRP